MTTFLQVHLLTAYPPANLNRDDLGRPKTAVLGGRRRLRISSQCLKRTWRTSDLFHQSLAGALGTRTKEMGREAYARLRAAGVSESNAEKWAATIADRFGKTKAKAKAPKSGEEVSRRQRYQHLDIEQLAHFGPDERAAIDALCDTIANEKRAPTKEELELLTKRPRAADIAMFGRMIAEDPKYNVEAAVQVAHALTVHAADIEDDYFSAVDDLNRGDEDAGAAHIGEQGFGAGVFYSYICIDVGQLKNNLDGESALAGAAIEALLRAACTVAPSGKQNSFASRAYASYVLVERGEVQPRSLAGAFISPIPSGDMVGSAIQRLSAHRAHFANCFEDEPASVALDAHGGTGRLSDVLAFARSSVEER